jgi:arylsulfatase
LRDIIPTLLHAGRVPIPETVEGRSLLPLCSDNQESWREYIHGEHAYRNLSHHFVTDGREKYIWFSQTGEEQFFNLIDDPEELVNRVNDPAYANRIVLWKEHLIRELVGREEGYVADNQLIIGKTPKTCLSHIL